MAFVGALDAFNSQPIQTKVGTSQTNIFTATSTKVTKDSSGKVNGGTTTVYYSANAGNYVPAATTNDGGKTWTYLKDSNGKEIFGTDAKTSLQQGALKNNTQQQILAATKQRPLGGGLSPEEQKIVAPSTQNAASGSGTGDGLSAATTQIESLNKLNETGGAISSDSKRNRDIKNYPGNDLLKYPIDLNPQEQDSISFTMLKYSPKKYANLSTLGDTGTIGGRDSQEKRRGSTVVLPIQPAITDLNTVEWGPDSMNAPELIAASLALNTILGGPEAATKSVTDIMNLIGKGNKDIQTAVAAKYAGEAAGTKGLLTRITGGIINPNMELLFNGPQLRTFQLNFSLSSREPKESKNIRNIIRFFKQGMSVKRSNTDLFLQSPHTFQIKYNYKGSEHPWINKIKECALTGCTVNYTPAGSYATFIDGAMTSYEIGLQFAELEALYDDDYVPDGGKGNESEIGY
jgi:hypothetical protein